MLDKFTANASLALGDGDRQELADAVMGVERRARPLGSATARAGLAASRGVSDASTLSGEREEIVRLIRDFVDRDVAPNVSRYEHADEFP